MHPSLAALLLVAALPGPSPAPPPPLSAVESDPVRRGVMRGSPVPRAAQVRWDDMSMWAFPNTRWAFSHMRELVPTVGIRRSGAVSLLPRAPRADLDALRFTTLDGRTMSWRDSLDANYTDGILVLHRGRIVYERYAGALDPEGQHIAFSVTKSFIGTLAEALIAEGRLDPMRTVSFYVPELARSGFGDATVRQVMDMRAGLAFDESYTGSANELTDIVRSIIASGLAPRPPGYNGPDGDYAFAASIGRRGAHGGPFVYATPNAVVLAWIVERVAGQSVPAQLQARFWSQMGMEQDAAMTVDRLGTAFSGGGLLLSLRDLARFGEMIRRGGRWNGRQVLPPAAVRAIMAEGSREAFASARSPGNEAGSYASMWWHRGGGQAIAVGVHGQGLYIDPHADLVIARFASHPVASNRGINAVSIPAYEAVAAHLRRSRR